MSSPLVDSAVVRVPVIPMTARRSSQSEQVSQAILGTPVRVEQAGTRWCRIETPDAYTGWVPRRALQPGAPEPAGEMALVQELWANLRARPDSRLPARLTAYIGTRLEVASRQERWVGLRLPGGGSGWVEAHRVRCGRPETLDGPLDPEALLATAQRFLGVPYLWGGCTPVGIDCSGYVQLVYRLHGLQLRRDTTDQILQGRAVAMEALAPADLVFFGPQGTASERVTHVGMMLDGGRFIHARGGQCVRINAVDEEEWERLFAGGRRLVQG